MAALPAQSSISNRSAERDDRNSVSTERQIRDTTVLVAGSPGRLGEALVRTLRNLGYKVLGLDILDGPFTDQIGSITDRSCVRRCMLGVRTVFHAATLHKPHVATHSRQDFVDTNIIGTLNLLEEAVTAGYILGGWEPGHER